MNEIKGTTDADKKSDATNSVDNPVSKPFKLNNGIQPGFATGDTFVGIEVIQGSPLDDAFIPSEKAEQLDGGAGVDIVDYTTSPTAVTADLSSGKQNAGGDAEGDILLNIEKLIGSTLDDTLSSQTPYTSLQGGDGNDTYNVGHPYVKIIESSGSGDDEVKTTYATLTLDPNVERLTYIGTANFTGKGNEENNVITGGPGNDTLLGGSGADQLIGGEGIDTASYADSPQAIIFNLKTGEHSGIAKGDTYKGIEILGGSTHDDTFIGSEKRANLDGHSGTDVIDYSESSEPISIDLSGQTPNQGDAEGDTLVNIEVIQGTPRADNFVGGPVTNNFIGGGGADSFDGKLGEHGAWYLTSAASVQVNLGTGTGHGGDAEGDKFSDIKNLMGSSFGDTLIGSQHNNKLEGGAGDDVIQGGPGDDHIYGGAASPTGSIAALTTPAIAQADKLHGGDGNDVIVSSASDEGTVIFGDSGNDKLFVNSGIAHGGEGDDTLRGWRNGYVLHGNIGRDTLELFGAGVAYGGEGSDKYIVETTNGVGIRDEGTQGHDVVVLTQIRTLEDVKLVSDGLNLRIYSRREFNKGNLNSAVILYDWFNGSKTIELFQVADGRTFMVGGSLVDDKAVEYPPV